MATRSADSSPDTSPISRYTKVAAILLFAAVPGITVARAPAADPAAVPAAAAAAAPADAALPADAGVFTVPPELEPEVRFWVRVYTEVNTDGGLLHDSWYLGLVYEVLRFDPDVSLAARERLVAAAKARYTALLRRFADGDTADLTRHERRILLAFGAGATRLQFLDAIERIRFQLGQANRFQEGLIRSQLWEGHIARTLQERGVPVEIAALPHVESSFNPAAYSRVGAAGLWQFMPSTARRYMRVDSLVDERLDPYRATEAAANLMLYNYNLLGSWPLAVTAYNHGPGGLRRAQQDLGSSDIAVIVKRYQGATFGFASRNFYVAFLAALEVDRNAETFFGPLTRLPDTQNTPVELPDYIPVEALAKAFKADLGALRVLNPALLPPIWEGQRFVPRGYALRLPGSVPGNEIAAGWSRLPMSERFVAQRMDAKYRVRRNESLPAVAAKLRLPLARLVAANGWTVPPQLQAGQVLRLPLPPSRADQAAPDAPAPPPLLPIPPPSPLRSTPALSSEPLVERQIPGNALLPAVTPTGSADATDYGVGPDDTIAVQPEETLGHFADWSGASAEALRTRNHLAKGTPLGLGRRIHLDLSHGSAAQFVAARTAYHRRLQEAYFAAHRIAGTGSYSIKRGDSLWIVAHQHGDLPLWLITQYNPDVDFNAMKPGTRITLPQVEAINRQ